MHSSEYADMFGFTKNEVTAILDLVNQKEQLDDVENWYNGYIAGRDTKLYNPWSIAMFVNKKELGPHWVDTGKFCIIGFWLHC